MSLQKIARCFSKSCGYEVEVAFGAKEALERIGSRQPDLLISDCWMPGLTGLQLSEHLKIHATGRLPVLLMSGSLQCEAAPGDSYDSFIRKPFLAENLLMEVSRLLGASRSSLLDKASAST